MPEIRALTGLRGVAALIVVWFHMSEVLAVRGVPIRLPLYLQRIFLSGGHSVDLFFVLSGLILALTYRQWFAAGLDTGHCLRFLRRRFARIYPLHFVILTLIIAFVLAAHVLGVPINFGFERFDFATLPQSFLLVQAWGPFLHGLGEWNPPAWSVSIEILAYLVFPLIMWLTARLGADRRWTLLGSAILIGFACNALTPWGNWGLAGVARGLSEFALGCVTIHFLDYTGSAWLRRPLGSFLALAVFLLVCASVTDTGFVVGLASAPLLLALCGTNPVSGFFAARPIHFLGEISYSIYLGHFLWSSVAWRLFSPQWMGTGTGAAVIGIAMTNVMVIGFSALTYYTVERPGRDFLNGRRQPAVDSDKATRLESR